MPGAEDIHRSLIETAASYLHLGWSVVPLWGDSRPEQAKVPAVAWAPYQRRRASEQDAARWFSGTPYKGLGIVTGSISQLVVLDFDDEDLNQRFATQCPELTATRIIRTRRGQHLYFRLPPHLRIQSRKLAGVDLLSDGCYVVAPPTTIDAHAYTVERGGLPKALTQDDIATLQRFLTDTAAQSTVRLHSGSEQRLKGHLVTPANESQEAAFTGQHGLSCADDAFLTADALVLLYRGMAGTLHRNAALFKAACLARDRGWKHEAVVAVLAPVHASQHARTQHRAENPKVRHREAERTIRSAFSKPPRPPQPQDKGLLFNSIREKLLQMGQTCVVRVLEGLHQLGAKIGQFVSERDLVTALKGIVGRHSIRKTLAAKLPNGKPLFEQARSPRYPPHRYAANQVRIDRQLTAFVTRSKSDSIRGRPENRYRIPSVKALCRLLGVAPGGSDAIALDNLRSAQQTRQALHRALIARRPGTYLRKWLGDRLGVSETTIWRYGKQIARLNSVPTFTQTPLGWGNLNAIPAPNVMPGGTCLEDSTGKRWPAVKGIAQKLLKEGRGVRLLVRSLNYYWIGTADPPALANGLQVQRQIDVAPLRETREPIVTFAQQVARLVRTIGGPTPPPHKTPEVVPVPVLQMPPPATVPTLRKRRRTYWKPLKDVQAETLAERVYAALNARTELADHRVSRATARQWVDAFGLLAVTAALDAFTTRRNVTKPAGWFKTFLRSQSRSWA